VETKMMKGKIKERFSAFYQSFDKFAS